MVLMQHRCYPGRSPTFELKLKKRLECISRHDSQRVASSSHTGSRTRCYRHGDDRRPTRVMYWVMILTELLSLQALALSALWPFSNARCITDLQIATADREKLEDADDVQAAELGVARCVERAATGGWASSGTGRGCSHEYDPDCG